MFIYRLYTVYIPFIYHFNAVLVSRLAIVVVAVVLNLLGIHIQIQPVVWIPHFQHSPFIVCLSVRKRLFQLMTSTLNGHNAWKYLKSMIRRKYCISQITFFFYSSLQSKLKSNEILKHIVNVFRLHWNSFYPNLILNPKHQHR